MVFLGINHKVAYVAPITTINPIVSYSLFPAFLVFQHRLRYNITGEILNIQPVVQYDLKEKKNHLTDNQQHVLDIKH